MHGSSDDSHPGGRVANGRGQSRRERAQPARGNGKANGPPRQQCAAGPSSPGTKPYARNGHDGVPVYGALDLGTNNCRLLLARPSRRGFLVIDAFSRIIRLGEGITKNGRLSDDAMTRTIAALRVCSDKMDRRGVTRSRLIATEACRAAENGLHFIRRVREETGLELEIVNRETEAHLAVCGCASLLDRSSDWALVFDIGGGSSELIWLDLSKHRGSGRRSIHDRLEVRKCIAAWTSLPVGVVSLAERFGWRFVNADVFERMVDHVLDLLEDFEAEHDISSRIAGRRVHLLGTSGTVTTVAGIHLGLPRYDRRRVDGTWMQTDHVRAVSESLAAMSYQERVAQPCIGSDRADLVLAGCAILDAMMRKWPCERLRVADRGLREGILTTLMAEDGVLRHDRSRRQGGGARRRRN